MNESKSSFSYTNTFELAGLTENQAVVYEVLLKHGEMTATKLFTKTPLKKGLLYKVLEELEELELIEKKEVVGKVTQFSPLHPDNLKKIISSKEAQIKNAALAVEGIWQNVTSDFNLIANRPTVQFFEGLEGAVKAVKDSLHAKEVCSYIDSEVVLTQAKELNDDYVKARHRLQVNHRLLVRNTPFEQKVATELASKFTHVRFLDLPEDFPAMLRIYNDTICYITLNPNKIVSVLIRDSHIYKLQKLLFEHNWIHAKEIKTATN